MLWVADVAHVLRYVCESVCCGRLPHTHTHLKYFEGVDGLALVAVVCSSIHYLCSCCVMVLIVVGECTPT